MKNNLYNIIYSLLIFPLLLSCTKTLANNETGADNFMNPAKPCHSLLNIIDEINSKTAHTYTREFILEGYFDNKSVKTAGAVHYINEPEAVRYVIYDAVLNSPFLIITAYQDKIQIHNSFENLLFIDRKQTFDLNLYMNIMLDFKIVYDLATDKIPVIGYQTIKSPENTGDSENSNKYLILENGEYFQTISFKDNIPDRILLTGKDKVKRFEIYLVKPFYTDGILFYKNIKIKALHKNFNIMLSFKKTKINIPLDLEKIIKLKLSGKEKIINRYQK